MRRFVWFLCFTSIACLGCLNLSAQRRGMTAEDYLAFETANDPQISPDGKSVAYTVSTIDQKANRRKSGIFIAALDGSRPPMPFTGESVSSSSPRWSPDGKYLAFLSAREGGKTQVWLLSTNGGEARRH